MMDITTVDFKVTLNLKMGFYNMDNDMKERLYKSIGDRLFQDKNQYHRKDNGLSSDENKVFNYLDGMLEFDEIVDDVEDITMEINNVKMTSGY